MKNTRSKITEKTTKAIHTTTRTINKISSIVIACIVFVVFFAVIAYIVSTAGDILEQHTWILFVVDVAFLYFFWELLALSPEMDEDTIRRKLLILGILAFLVLLGTLGMLVKGEHILSLINTIIVVMISIGIFKYITEE